MRRVQQCWKLRTLAVTCLGWAAVMGLWPTEAKAVLIGPDAFGYTATDSTTYSFVDITQTGTRLLSGFDDATTVQNIGFTFNFYGTDYTSVSWSPNGLMSFGGTNSQFGNVDLTSTAPAGNLPSIAPLWDDWSFSSLNSGADATYVQTIGSPGSRQFIVQWNNAFGFPTSPNGVTFETILNEGSNNILFQYQNVLSGDTRDHGASATVGIRDISGESNGRNLQWSFNSPDINNQEAILFTTHNSSTPVIPEPTSLYLMSLGLAGIGWRGRRRTR